MSITIRNKCLACGGYEQSVYKQGEPTERSPCFCPDATEKPPELPKVLWQGFISEREIRERESARWKPRADFVLWRIVYTRRDVECDCMGGARWYQQEISTIPPEIANQLLEIVLAALDVALGK